MRYSARHLAFVALTVLGLAGVSLVYYRELRAPGLPEGLIQVNGRIEGDVIAVASKVPGRIAQLPVREGDAVTAGQIVARLDATQAQARVVQARKAAAALRAELQAAQGRERQAGRDAARYRRLAAQGVASARDDEQARLAWKIARDQLRAARAQLNRAEAALAETESALADCTITAPAAGIVVTRVRQAGEVVAAGAPLLDLVDLDALYLKAYVPERLIGKLRLGLPARIYTDAYPDQPFPATVRYIASRAEFTPREVQTPDERVKLVYAVKLQLDANPDHRLTPGLPADAVIRWRQGVDWARPRW